MPRNVMQSALEPAAVQDKYRIVLCCCIVIRDQPTGNSRFHGRDIFREIGLLP